MDCGLLNQKLVMNEVKLSEFRNPKSAIERVLNMNKDDMKRKTMQFGLNIITLVEGLPRGRTADAIGNQLLRSGTSVGANYRAACRARSKADFISKMGLVKEEADESIYWMELLVESEKVDIKSVESLMNGGNEILAITVSSIKTARSNK